MKRIIEICLFTLTMVLVSCTYQPQYVSLNLGCSGQVTTEEWLYILALNLEGEENIPVDLRNLPDDLMNVRLNLSEFEFNIQLRELCCDFHHFTESITKQDSIPMDHLNQLKCLNQDAVELINIIEPTY